MSRGDKMSQCPNCGHQVKDDTSQCPNCGQLLTKKKKRKIKDQSSQSSNENSTNIRLRKIVPIGISVFILILIIVLFFLLRNYNSPNAQAKILVNAVDNNDSQKVATLLSTKNKKVDDVEAQQYINYVKKEVGIKKYIRDINNTVDKLNKSNSSVASYIQTKSGQDVLKISKNGTKYLIFDNMSFTAPTKKPIIKPKVETKYEFRTSGKKENCHC